MKKLTLLFLVLLMACAITPEPISYGKDNCEFCKMTIMDNAFGCELVTQKGKIFKFDDLHCMVKYIQTTETQPTDYKHIVVNPMDNKGSLVATESAFFVQSEELRSPMAGNIGAFSTSKAAEEYISKNNTSKQLTWKDVLEAF